MKALAGSIAAIAGLIGIAFSVFFFMDSRHASVESVQAVEVEQAIQQLEQITLEEQYMPDAYPAEVKAYRQIQKERLKRKVEQASK